MRLFSLGPTSSVIAKSRRMRARVYFNEIAARNRGRRTVSSNLTPSARKPFAPVRRRSDRADFSVLLDNFPSVRIRGRSL